MANVSDHTRGYRLELSLAVRLQGIKSKWVAISAREQAMHASLLSVTGILILVAVVIDTTSCKNMLECKSWS